MQTKARVRSRAEILGLTLALTLSCALGVAFGAGEARGQSEPSFVDRLLSYGWNAPLEAPMAETEDLATAPPKKVAKTSARKTPPATLVIPAEAVPVEAMREPMSDRDAALYKKIFAAQEKGEWKEADSLLLQLGDKRLIGHVLHQRYMHPTDYRASFDELKAWLAAYADHPGAQRLYALALARMPSGGGEGLRKPAAVKRVRISAPDKKSLDAAISPSAPTRDERAKGSSAGWVSGMNAWRAGSYEKAAKHFESAAMAKHASDWTRSAAAFWASRAHMRAGNLKEVSPWLHRAAQYPRTFYGLIATRALGKPFDFNWTLPEFTGARYRKLVSIPQGARAIALAAAGRQDLAEAELRTIDPGEDGDLREAMLSFAARSRIPALAMELAHAIPAADGGVYDAALYPLAPWEPKDGFTVDPALIHAIMRQESKFDPEALSHKGARGLMQIMPGTARHVVKGRDLPHDHGPVGLVDPLANVEIGQHYIEELMGQKAVDRDLFSLAIAYNAGPGNLSRWKSRLRHVTDPLLFIESIPVSETRAYVERVLANYWIYKMRMGESVETLDAVAAGQWAKPSEDGKAPERRYAGIFSSFWQ